MKRILHLSDLHFGRDEPGLQQPLLDRIAALKPDVVVVSGDLTQRARISQFKAARDFLDRIEAPLVVVPGNHDTPLDNLFVRLLRPFGRFRKYIARRTEGGYGDAEVSILGVNTVNPWAWQQGRLSKGKLRRILAEMGEGGERLRVLAMHHPLEHRPDADKRLMRGAGRALSAFAAGGIDVVLSGHLHAASAAPFSTAPGLLFVQAGTGLSTRLRGEVNTFNLLDWQDDELRITTFHAREAGSAWFFEGGAPARFARTDLGWDCLDSGDQPRPETIATPGRAAARSSSGETAARGSTVSFMPNPGNAPG